MNLPPIFVMLDQSGEALRMFHSQEVAALNSSRNAGSTVVRYEPAVPKCATCERFRKMSDLPIRAFCEHTDKSWSPVPPDGSGYCHRHPEAKK